MMNGLHWIYLFGSFFSITIGLLVYFKGSNKNVGRVFVWFTTMGFYWCLTVFGLQNAKNYNEAFIWYKIGSFWLIGVSALLHFTLVFSKKERWLKNRFFYPAVYLPSVVLSLIDLNTGVFLKLVETSSGWTTMVSSLSPVTMIFDGWTFFLSGSAIGVCLSYFISVKDSEVKQQVKYVLIGLIVPIFVGISTDKIVPIMTSEILKLSVFGYITGLAFISYSVLRYKMFKITDDVAAEKIVSTIPDMLMFLDTKGVIKTVNDAAAKALGYEKNELIGKHHSLLFHDWDAYSKKFSKNVLNELSYDLYNKNKNETELVTKEGRRIPVIVSESEVKDNRGVVGRLVICRDITELKRRDHRLRQYVKKLEDNELAMLSIMEDLRLSNQEIEALNEKLEEKVAERTREVQKLLKQKDDFIHMLGHDLKNPMTPIAGLLPLIKERTNDPKSKQLLDVVIENTNYMKTLVLKTLKLARLNSPSTKFDIEDTNLLEELNNVIKSNKPIFDENNIKINNKIKEDIVVKADKLMLKKSHIRKILIHLCSYGNKSNNIKGNN